nr:actin-related protein 2/3 complex subunit 1A-like [Meriones unguiculatus]
MDAVVSRRAPFPASPAHGRPCGHWGLQDGVARVSTLKTGFLLLLSVSFVLDNSIVAAGHKCCLILFSYNDHGGLSFVSKLDVPKQNTQHSMDKRATSKDRKSMALEMVHQNSITQVSICEVDKQDCCKLCTTSIDGAMTIWDFKFHGLERAVVLFSPKIH